MLRKTAGVLVFLIATSTAIPGENTMDDIVRDTFGKTGDGKAVERFTLTNEKGTVARLITYGATLTELLVRDRDGNPGDVVLGFDTFEQYEKESPFFGCTTGRVANRIARGRFILDGVEHELAVNDGPNHLHGGIRGLDKVIWEAGPVAREDGPAVRFAYLSPDGEEGYPGNLSIAVIYVLTGNDELRIEYEATTDRATPVNLTNHSYFNLAGAGDILGHILTLHASVYTEPDETLIPTGRILPVAGTPLDFTRPATVGGRLGRVDIGGYDHNYVIDRKEGEDLALTAELYDPESGRVMELFTTEPGVQFYSGNFLDGLKGKKDAVYEKHHGLCLETQHFPDSINQPEFPSVVLRPGETYRQVTVHRFSTR